MNEIELNGIVLQRGTQRGKWCELMTKYRERTAKKLGTTRFDCFARKCKEHKGLVCESCCQV